MTSTQPELAGPAVSFAAHSACFASGLCLVAALLLTLGAGCMTEDVDSSQPWGGKKSWEWNAGSVPPDWNARGR
jgi:hypothetical protein